MQAMVIAKKGNTIYLGGNIEMSVDELIDSDKWTHVFHPHH